MIQVKQKVATERAQSSASMPQWAKNAQNWSFEKPADTMKRLGIVADPKPSEDASETLLPRDITSLSDVDLRKLHGRLRAWVSYRQSQHAEVGIALMHAKEELARHAAVLAFGQGKIEKYRMESSFHLDPKWKTLRMEVLRREAEYSSLELEISKLEGRAMVCSREQSFREVQMKARL